ncbi:carboxymethylenebutenolidase [Sphingomonas oleivorans]|uniref:Carboxymethylenebutenolidase n=1 Tax=Sphingomonas oleivorans TaxID=1735121 RepID=A0A2T5G029_9SPHN|nr:dienelactone hydrolase family protein [Sphingomonas oleivorans]PTQ12309.1 carboxymethylenebutenolidase [Sphingomonas oleivorans]
MDETELRARAIALYDRFTHVTHDRRAFMGEMAKLAGSAAAANALVASIAASPAAAAMVDPADKRLVTGNIAWPGSGGHRLSGYFARPRAVRGKLPTVIVVHENRGLNGYIQDVTRRLALAGFLALAPDFLSPAGGTPANEDQAREMIGKLDLPATVADGVATIAWLKTRPRSNGKVGVIGFCWGGALVDRLAVAAGAGLDAGVSFYGPPPPPAEAAKVKAPLLLHYAGTDERVNAGAAAWVEALKAARVPVTRHDYPGTQHAFHNDTSAARYNAEAAKLAWDRSIAFLKEHLS